MKCFFNKQNNKNEQIDLDERLRKRGEVLLAIERNKKEREKRFIQEVVLETLKQLKLYDEEK